MRRSKQSARRQHRKRGKRISKRNQRLALDGTSGPVTTRKATPEDLERFKAGGRER